MINAKNMNVIEPGYFTVSVGGEQPGFTGTAKSSCTETLSGRIKLSGKVYEIK
jgi:beta-glucosidase